MNIYTHTCIQTKINFLLLTILMSSSTIQSIVYNHQVKPIYQFLQKKTENKLFLETLINNKHSIQKITNILISNQEIIKNFLEQEQNLTIEDVTEQQKFLNDIEDSLQKAQQTINQLDNSFDFLQLYNSASNDQEKESIIQTCISQYPECIDFLYNFDDFIMKKFFLLSNPYPIHKLIETQIQMTCSQKFALKQKLKNIQSSFHRKVYQKHESFLFKKIKNLFKIPDTTSPYHNYDHKLLEDAINYCNHKLNLFDKTRTLLRKLSRATNNYEKDLIIHQFESQYPGQIEKLIQSDQEHKLIHQLSIKATQELYTKKKNRETKFKLNQKYDFNNTLTETEKSKFITSKRVEEIIAKVALRDKNILDKLSKQKRQVFCNNIY